MYLIWCARDKRSCNAPLERREVKLSVIYNEHFVSLFLSKSLAAALLPSGVKEKKKKVTSFLESTVFTFVQFHCRWLISPSVLMGTDSRAWPLTDLGIAFYFVRGNLPWCRMCSLHMVSFLDAAADHSQNVETKPMTSFFVGKMVPEWHEDLELFFFCPISTSDLWGDFQPQQLLRREIVS